MKKFLISSTMAAVAVFCASSANAYVVYTGVDNNGNPGLALSSTPNSTAAATAFLSQLTGSGTETFETRSGSAPLVLDFGATGTATLTGAGTVASNSVGGTNGAGRYSVPGGTRYWETSAGPAGLFAINFSQDIAAFGFYGIDIGDFGGTLTLEFRNSANALVNALNVTTAAQNVADGSVLYFGVIASNDSEMFSSVRFVSTVGSGDVFALDSFTIGAKEQVSAVPEPTTLALLGLGLLGFGAARRRGAARR